MEKHDKTEILITFSREVQPSDEKISVFFGAERVPERDPLPGSHLNEELQQERLVFRFGE